MMNSTIVISENVVYARSLFLLMALLIFSVLISSTFYKSYLNLHWGKALLIGFLTTILAAVNMLFSIYLFESQHIMANWRQILPITLLAYFFVPLVFQMYRKWVGGHLTDTEKIPGPEGFRAWLSVGNLVCALGSGFLLWIIFYRQTDLFSLVVITFFSVMVVLACPIINTFLHLSENRTPPGDDLSTAQIKILKMLEDGRINSQECAELLGALRGTSLEPPPAPPSPPPSNPSIG